MFGVCVPAESLQLCSTLCSPMDCSPQGSSVHILWGFSRQEYWSGLPCPPPGDLPNPGTEPTSLMSSALAGRFFTTSAAWEALKGVQLLANPPPQKAIVIHPFECSASVGFLYFRLTFSSPNSSFFNIYFYLLFWLRQVLVAACEL